MIAAATPPVKLNLGAGDSTIDGYLAVDRSTGGEVFPLDVPDGSVAEIRASHVLEHFSHRETAAVIADWVRALEPGGLLRVAVPDFDAIIDEYARGTGDPIESYLMGGHVDQNDHHGAIFNERKLTQLLNAAGLRGVCRWTSEIQDCASLAVSLNLQAWKPPAVWPRVVAVMSVPRLGFMDNAACAERALRPLDIGVRHTQGAFWGQCLTRGIERAIAEDDPEFVLTVDYDSVYTRQHVEGLISAMMRHEHADCVAAVQMHRREPRALFTLEDASGASVIDVDRVRFRSELMSVASAHFGLTLFRASSLVKCRRPWFLASPDSEGRWEKGRTDDDVAFWRQWRASGLNVQIANRVAVGHAELAVRWPNADLGVTIQDPTTFHRAGPPEDVWL